MAQNGSITKLHPPMNDGTAEGSGKITPADGGNDVKFHTPDDNNSELLDSTATIYYTLDSNGTHVERMSHSDPGDGGFPDDGGDGSTSKGNGFITKLHPPMNDGTADGNGEITPADGGNVVKFHTPEDNSGELLDSTATIYYTLDSNGKKVVSMSHTDPDAGGIPDDGGIGDPG